MVAQRGARSVIGRLGGQTTGAFARWLNRRIPPASQVQLNHRRIFILPSRAGLGLMLLLLIMLIGAINYQNSLIYAVTFVLASLFWVSLYHTYRNLSGLQLRGTGSRPVFAGESAPFDLTLRAQDREHQSVRLRWSDETPQQVDVGKDEDVQITLYHQVHKRGWFRPGRLRIETRYPLGWFVAWSLVDLELQALVYPRPVDAPLPSAGRSGEGEGDQPHGEGVDDFQGLRAYQPGDSRKRLDWRAWSRGQGLHSKVFAEPLRNSLWLDLDVAPGVDLEQRLGCLAGWVLQLEQTGQPYGLKLPGEQIAPGVGDAHRDACLRAVALYGVAK